MTNIDHAIDTYRDNQLHEHLEGKEAKAVSFGALEDEDEIIVMMPADIDKMLEDSKRHCTQCSKPIKEGSFYVVHDGEEHYCSDDCLTHNYSGETYLKMYENDEAYYTEID